MKIQNFKISIFSRKKSKIRNFEFSLTFRWFFFSNFLVSEKYVSNFFICTFPTKNHISHLWIRNEFSGSYFTVWSQPCTKIPSKYRNVQKNELFSPNQFSVCMLRSNVISCVCGWVTILDHYTDWKPFLNFLNIIFWNHLV